MPYVGGIRMARSFLALGILLLVQNAQAATNVITTELQRPKRFQVSAIAQTESNLYEDEARERDSKGRISLTPSYKLTSEYQVSLSMGLMQDFERNERAQVTNFRLSLAHVPVRITEDSYLIPVVGVRLPTNVLDRKENSYNGSALAEGTILTNWRVANVNFTTVYGAYLLKNFHTWEQAASHAANLSYSVRNYFGIEKYIIADKLSILFDGDYTYAETYTGSMRTLFSLSQSITYEYSRQFSVTAGHSNGGDALKANGRDYDISVYDGNTSTVYAYVRAVY